MKKIFIISIFIQMILSNSVFANKIVKFEYWFDNNYSSAITKIDSSASILFIDEISISDLNWGLHNFNIRFQDSLGLWSNVQSKYFVVPREFEKKKNSNHFVKYEYWFDNNYSSAITKIDSSASIQLIDEISISDLNWGLHNFNIRFQDSLGLWSNVQSKYFVIPREFEKEKENSIVGFRYFFDSDFSEIRYLKTFNKNEYIENLTDLPLGKHHFHIQYKDSFDLWSTLYSKPFEVTFQYIVFGNKVAFSVRPDKDYQYKWDFGDGLSDSVPCPTHDYKRGGLYDVTLKFKKEGKEWDSTSRQVGVTGVKQLFPDKGGNTGDVTHYIYGHGFTDTTKVWLTKIIADTLQTIYPDTTVKIDENVFIARYNLREKDKGFWNFNINGFANDTSLSIPNAFEIEEGWSDYSIQYTSRAVRAGQTYSFPITITNLGNVDIDFPSFYLSNTTQNPIGFSDKDLRLNLNHLNLYSSNINDLFNKQIVPKTSKIINIFSKANNNRSSFFIENTLTTKSWIPSPVDVLNKLIEIIVDRVDNFIGNFDWLIDRRNDCTVVPDFNFSSACYKHDRCYEECCINKSDCDNTFYHNMCKICNEVQIQDQNYYSKLFGEFGLTFAKRKAELCRKMASAYHRGVTTWIFGNISKDLFIKTQINQGKLGKCPKNNCIPCFENVYPQKDCEPPDPPEDPDNLNGDPFADVNEPTWNNQIIQSYDPNDITGPKSTLEPNYYKSTPDYSYQIRCENDTSATAPAQKVVILNQLDKSKFDLNTIQLNKFTIGNQVYEITPGLQEYMTEVKINPTDSIVVRVDIKLDTALGVIKWEMTAIDTNTRMLIEDPFAGFLPPNILPPQGEGSVSYSVKPLTGLANGTEIYNKASIIFDWNEPIVTNEWLNTIDDDKPLSKILTLDSLQDSTSFLVKWTGEDTTSGVEYYNIYCKENEGESFIWKYMTSDTEAFFTGYNNSKYSFYSVGVDYAGNVESKNTFETNTQINAPFHKIPLNTGWNLISSYIIPQLPDIMETTCQTINDKLVIAKNRMGQTYIPQYEINQIGSWNYKQAYQLYLSSKDTLVITGLISNPEDEPIDLSLGWNWVSYMRNTPMDAPVAFQTILDADELLIAKNYSGQVFIPSFGINQIGNLQPGQGYQIYMQSVSQLTYPANELGKAASNPRIPNPFYLIPKYQITGNSSVAILQIKAPNGDEIGVFNQNDELIGSGVVHNGYAAVIIWGDNDQTEETDGAKDNYELRIKSYEIKTGRLSDVIISDLVNYTNGEKLTGLNYQKDAVYFAKATVENNKSTISLNVRPNPASEIIEIELETPDCKASELKIYSLNGELIKDITGKLTESNYQKVKENIDNLTNGEYTIILTCGNERAMRKVVVVR